MFDQKSGLSVYNSIVRNSRLMIELALCSQRKDLSGIYLAPSFSNPQTWFGLIYIRYGIYSSAAYRFLIIMGDDYFDPMMMKFPISKEESYAGEKSRNQSDEYSRRGKSSSIDSKEKYRGSHWNLPRIYFYAPTKPYHPHVDPVTGELNLAWYWGEGRNKVAKFHTI